MVSIFRYSSIRRLRLSFIVAIENNRETLIKLTVFAVIEFKMTFKIKNSTKLSNAYSSGTAKVRSACLFNSG